MLRLAPPGFERFLQSPQFVATFGGGEANVAVALAGFGMAAAYVTVLPPANPIAPPASAETGRQAVPAAVTADKARAPLPLPAEQITALLTRGDAFVRTRDIASARLFYERAADAGNGRAALRMGESFDRAFLDSIGIYRMIGDRQLALSWYRRARDLGDTEAAQLLHKLEPR